MREAAIGEQEPIDTRPVTAILVFGPTAVGKSEIVSSIARAKRISLVSADSVQVFRGLDIASAKPSREEMAKYPHHLIDIKSPFDAFNVSEFVERADKAVEESLAAGRIPVICGGSAYYMKHFIYGLSDAPASDPAVRAKVEEIFSEKGLAHLYGMLERADPVSARRIGPYNTNRIKRAVEVHLQTGRPLSSFAVPTAPRSECRFRIFGLYRDREDLRERIRRRLDVMFRNGLVEEIERLKSQGLTLKNQSMNSIGYKEFFLSDDLDRIREMILSDTIHYAKRQMTFFRSLGSGRMHVKWIRLEGAKGL